MNPNTNNLTYNVNQIVQRVTFLSDKCKGLYKRYILRILIFKYIHSTQVFQICFLSINLTFEDILKIHDKRLFPVNRHRSTVFFFQFRYYCLYLILTLYIIHTNLELFHDLYRLSSRAKSNCICLNWRIGFYYDFKSIVCSSYCAKGVHLRSTKGHGKTQKDQSRSSVFSP